MKKTILIFIDWYLPGYKAGGPIRSVANIVKNLSDNFNFIIITSDRDFGDTTSYKNIILNKLIKKDDYTIIYLSPENQKKSNLIEIIKKIDFNTVYFNNLFSLKFTILPLKIIKKHKKNTEIILAPRGMLGKGALGLKRRKKQVFLFSSKLIGLYKNIIWHATDEIEKQDIITNYGLKNKIHLISNISSKPEFYKQKEKKITKFIFLSRLAKKKNLLFAIKLFQKIEIKTEIIFSIFGTNEDIEYLQECRREILKIKNNITINFEGSIKHSEVNKILSEYHFYILPTLHENFGHSIFEAFSAGCPVIISDQTPWRDLENKKIGWDISLNNNQKFIDTIKYCVQMKQDEYNTWSKNAFDFAEKTTDSKELLEKYNEMFNLDFS